MIKYVKNGKEYERKAKAINCDTHLNIRISKEQLDKLKENAKDNNTSYSKIIQKLIQDYNNGLLKVEL